MPQTKRKLAKLAVVSTAAIKRALDTQHDFVIEKDVPIPQKGGGRWPSPPPMLRLEVGDSVFLAGIKQSVAMGRCNVPRKLGRKFTTRAVDGGTRVWRTA